MKISWLFLVSHLFLTYFPEISWLFLISRSFLNHFSIIYDITHVIIFVSACFIKVMNMDEVSFLYDCVKGGKLSKQQAKEILYSNKSLPLKSDVQKQQHFVESYLSTF